MQLVIERNDAHSCDCQK